MQSQFAISSTQGPKLSSARKPSGSAAAGFFDVLDQTLSQDQGSRTEATGLTPLTSSKSPEKKEAEAVLESHKKPENQKEIRISSEPEAKMESEDHAGLEISGRKASEEEPEVKEAVAEEVPEAGIFQETEETLAVKNQESPSVQIEDAEQTLPVQETLEPQKESEQQEVAVMQETSEEQKIPEVQEILAGLLMQYQNSRDFDQKEKVETKIDLLISRLEKAGKTELSEDALALLRTIQENLQNPALPELLESPSFEEVFKELQKVAHSSLEGIQVAPASVERPGQEENPDLEMADSGQNRDENFSEALVKPELEPEESPKQKTMEPVLKDTEPKSPKETEPQKQVLIEAESKPLKESRLEKPVLLESSKKTDPVAEIWKDVEVVSFETEGAEALQERAEEALPESHLRDEDAGAQTALARLILKLDSEAKSEARPLEEMTEAMPEGADISEMKPQEEPKTRREEAWQRVLLSLQKHGASKEVVEKVKPGLQGMEALDLQKSDQPKTISHRMLNHPSFRSSSQVIVNQVKEAMMEIRPPQISRLHIILRPESLGEVRAELKLQDGHLRLRFEVENSTVKEVLERSTVQLRDALKIQGLEKAEIEIRTKDSSSQQQFGADHQKNQADEKAHHRRQSGRNINLDDNEEEQETMVEATVLENQSLSSGRLNQYI